MTAIYLPHESVHSDPYTRIPNDLINSGLSPETAFLLIYMKCQSRNFVLHEKTLLKRMQCGREKLQKLRREAREAGYMKLETISSEDNTFKGSQYVFALAPVFLVEKQNEDVGETGFQAPGSVPSRQTRLCINNKQSINKEEFINKKDIKNKQKENDAPKKPHTPSPKARVVCENENLEKQFEQFWEAYDYKKDKSNAFEKFKKALNHVSLEQMLKAIQEQAIERSIKLRKGLFHPNRCLPSTWLNKRRWGDSTQSEEEILQEALKKKKGGRTAFERSMDLERRCEKAMDEAILEELGITKDDLEKQFDGQLKNKLDHKG